MIPIVSWLHSRSSPASPGVHRVGDGQSNPNDLVKGVPAEELSTQLGRNIERWANGLIYRRARDTEGIELLQHYAGGAGLLA